MNKAPDQLRSAIPKYAVSNKVRAAYDEELLVWIVNGWLIPYPQKFTKVNLKPRKKPPKQTFT